MAMAIGDKSLVMQLLLMMMMMDMASVVRGGLTPAQQACVEPLETLLDCLNYVQGKASLPSLQCCTNMGNVYKTNPRCLCELIAASFQGGISGLPAFNQTLAFSVPKVCNVPADPANCPALLGIPASSPEAKEFQVHGSNGTSPSSPSSNSTSSPSSLSSSSSSAMYAKSSASYHHIQNHVYFLFCTVVVFLFQ